MVNEKLRKRSVSGVVLAKGFDDTKSEEQTIKSSENIFKKPEQTKELKEEDFFGITTYHKDSNNYPTRGILSNAKEMNVSDYTENGDTRIGHYHDDDDERKIGDAEEVSTDIIQTKSLADSREEHQPRQKDNQKKENLEAQDTSNNLDKMGQTASGIKPTYKDNADESFLRRVNTFHNPGQHQDHDQAKIEFNKSDNVMMKKIGDADKINLRRTEEVSTDIIQTKSLADSREEHQPRQKDNQKKENLEAQDTSNNLDKMGQTASGIKPTYKDNADESFLRRIMERVDNTTKLPQKHSKETRLTIGNINIQITNSSSNTVNNNSRNVNIKETTHDGNSADLAIWSNTFDKTYHWKFRYT